MMVTMSKQASRTACQGLSWRRSILLLMFWKATTASFQDGSFVVAAASAAVEDIEPSTLPKMDKSLPQCPQEQYLPKYHAPRFCTFGPTGMLNPEVESATRAALYHRLVEQGIGASRVPNERTIVCPVEDEKTNQPSTRLNNNMYDQGMNRKWIFENLASTSVSIHYVHRDNGTEVSALKPNDPSHVTVMNPGEWGALPVIEGDVFHVREYSDDAATAAGSNNRGGRLILQHRVGLVPFWSNHQWDCQQNVTTTKTITRTVIDKTTGETKVIEKTKEVTEISTEDIEPSKETEFRRTPTHKNRKCNTIDLGIRNLVNCPLHVYWAANLPVKDIPSDGASCQEQFKFHLGTHPKTQDFHTDWKSSTKWEGSYISHTFVARLAANPSVVIDSYNLAPTHIVDCPTKKPDKVQLATVIVEPTVVELPVVTGGQIGLNQTAGKCNTCNDNPRHATGGI